jgi:SAM-dependent methyltransferase/GNAT superfamily N-acetyltransferase
MIRPCSPDDFGQVLTVINDGAGAYEGFIPPDRWYDPYMPEGELRGEIEAGVAFTGFYDGDELLGVMGFQDVEDVTLIRHAYVRTSHRRQGIGGRLLQHLLQRTDRPVLVGTWAAGDWAIRFYRKHGFRLLPDHDRVRLLQRYWTIPARQIETSVVLADPAWMRLNEVPCQFQDVDRSSDPDTLTGYLTAVSDMETVRAYKTLALDLLAVKPGNRILDVGCGLGQDAAVLADAVGPPGQVVALDSSLKMVSEVRATNGPASPVVALVGDAVKLPFPDRCFDGCRTDRVLQHVPAPREAVAELARVTRPGGRVVTAEPDWATLSLKAPDPHLTREIARYGCESIPSGRVGRDTGRMLADAGLSHVSVREVVLVTETFEEADRLFRLRDFVQGAAREHRISSGAAAGWIEAVETQDASEAFSGSLTLFLATGVKQPEAK